MKWPKLIAAVALLSGGIILGAAWQSNANGSQAVPGSVEDPVVTKSYVDKLLSQNGGTSSSAANTAMQVVSVAAGKKLLATEEGTEFIVRSGKAIAYSEDKDGISNLTSGTDLVNGKAVANNNLLLSPRAGRGITTDSSVSNNKLIVLVKGGYQLK